jgi:tetratricopeptide (TPR) repeat protein
MRLFVLMLALALVPAVRAVAQEPQPTPAPEEQAAETAQEPAAQEPAAETTATAAPTGSADEHISAGLSAFRKRRFASARGHFEQAVAADPGSAAAHFYLGYTIYKIAEPKRPFHPDKQKAADLFAKAYELDPAFKPNWGPRT